MSLLNEIKSIEVKKPSKKQFIIPSIILIVCLVFGGWLLNEGRKCSIDPPKISFLTPGVTKVNLEEIGSYSIYIETEIQYEGKLYSIPYKSIDKIDIDVSKNGEKIPVRTADIFYKYNKNGNKGETNLNFDITEPGQYEINSDIESNEIDQVVLSVGRKNEGMLRVLQFTVGASVIILVGVFQFVGYILSGMIRLLMYKKLTI